MAETNMQTTTGQESQRTTPSRGAAEKVQEVAGEVTRHAGDVAGDVKSQTQHLLSRTKEEIDKEASNRTGQFASMLHELAEELRKMADADREGRLEGVASGAADRAERLASQLDQRGFDGIVQDLKSTVRQRPGLVLGVAAAAGFVMGRIVRDAGKAQSSNDARSQASGPSSTGSAASATPTSRPDLVLDETAGAPTTAAPLLGARRV